MRLLEFVGTLTAMKAIVLLLTCMCYSLHAQQFPPPGFKETSSDESPESSFKTDYFQSQSEWQIWIETLKPSDVKTQLLYKSQTYIGNYADCLINDDDTQIAINHRVGSGYSEFYVFSLGKDGMFHEKMKDIGHAALALATKQLKIKMKLDLDHFYGDGVAWLGDNDDILLASISGHHSGNGKQYYGLSYYFLYDAPNDRLMPHLDDINRGALQRP